MWEPEFCKLKKDLVDLSEISKNVLVPFLAKRLKNVTVAWINDRWLLERGINAIDEEFRGKFSRWLIQNYGYLVPMVDDDLSFFLDDHKTFYADRYGETAGARHGGSGRAGGDAFFHVKGIGQTPLIGEGADWLHSNGVATIEEALREAVYSEVFDLECPFGAIPVVAILDTHLNLSSMGGPSGERRALIVRPNVVRVAHMQRATHFRPMSDVRSSQLDDSRRTSDFVEWFVKKKPTDKGVRCNSPPDFDVLNGRIADQVAFCEIYRLFHGGFYSSNLSINGEILDFGGARSLPDWRRAEFVQKQPRFGDDLNVWLNVARSICYYMAKYEGPLNNPHWESECIAGYISSFGKYCLELWGLDVGKLTIDLANRIIFTTRSLFLKQQKELVSYIECDPYTHPWIYSEICDLLAGRKKEGYFSSEIQEVIFFFKELYADEPNALVLVNYHLNIAARQLKPRIILYREILQPYIRRCLESSTDVFPKSEFSADALLAISHTMGRRYWPRLKDKLIYHQFSDGVTSCFIIGVSMDSNDKYIHMICFHLNELVLIFGRWYPMSSLDGHMFLLDNQVWEGTFDNYSFKDNFAYINIGISKIRLGPFFEAV